MILIPSPVILALSSKPRASGDDPADRDIIVHAVK